MRKQSKIPFISKSTITLGALSILAVDVSAAVLEEVVVTARKREESLQETPVSVMAFNSRALETQNVGDISDLSAKLPSVHIGGGGGLGGNNAAFYIRGLGTARNAVNQESAVALYIDDFYYGRSDGALLGVVDVQNIEVLRGPQGTLFGRNATAGAIRYVTKKPDFDDTFYKIKADFGTDNKMNLSGSANFAVSDSTAASLLIATNNQDGFVENALGQDLGEQGTDLFRAYLRNAPSATVEILTQVDYSETDSHGGVSQSITVDPVTRDITGFAPGSDWDTSTSDLDAFLDSETLGLGVSANWDITDSLALKWVTTYRTLETQANFDFDGDARPVFDQTDLDRSTDAWSTELQLSGNTESTQWMTGIFYYVEESDDFRRQGPNIRETVAHDLDSVGVFAQVGVDLTDRFSVTTGIRYTQDSKDAAFREGRTIGGVDLYNEIQPDGSMIPNSAPVTGNTVFSNDDSWGAMSGRIALEYQAADDIFIFGSYARGFRAGGINDRPRFNDASINYGITTFDEEVLDVWELGIRSEWFDRRLRLNLTYFFQEMKDLQFGFALGNTTARAVGNAAEAESKGFEGEVIFAATDNLSFDANFGTLDAEITGADPTTGLNKGDVLSQAPDLKYSLGATYDVYLDGGSLSFRLDYSYQDETQTEVVFSNVAIIDEYDLLGFNIRYTPTSEDWNVSLYGSNVTDEEYFQFATVAGPSQNAVPARGSEYGVKFEYNFR